MRVVLERVEAASSIEVTVDVKSERGGAAGGIAGTRRAVLERKRAGGSITVAIGVT